MKISKLKIAELVQKLHILQKIAHTAKNCTYYKKNNLPRFGLYTEDILSIEKRTAIIDRATVFKSYLK